MLLGDIIKSRVKCLLGEKCENNEVFQGYYINLVDIIIAIFKDPVRGTIISQLSHGVPY